MADNGNIASSAAAGLVPVKVEASVPADEGDDDAQLCSPREGEVAELLPADLIGFYADRKSAAYNFVAMSARKDRELEEALGPVIEDDEPSQNEIGSILAVFENTPLWKDKWTSRTVRRAIVRSRRRRRLGPPGITEDEPGKEALRDIREFITAMSEGRGPAENLTSEEIIKGVGILTTGVEEFCQLALKQPRNLRDAFIDYAVNMVKERLLQELHEDRFVPGIQAWERLGDAEVERRLEQRLGPTSGRLPYFLNDERRGIRREDALNLRLFMNYKGWRLFEQYYKTAREHVYLGHRGPLATETTRQHAYRTFIINTAIKELTQKVDGAQRGEYDAGQPISEARTKAEYLTAHIRHLVAEDKFIDA